MVDGNYYAKHFKLIWLNKEFVENPQLIIYASVVCSKGYPPLLSGCFVKLIPFGVVVTCAVAGDVPNILKLFSELRKIIIITLIDGGRGTL